MGPTGPFTINCGQVHRAFEAVRNKAPFARGAHKAVFLADYHGMPMVLKQLFIVNDDDDPDNDDGDDDVDIDSKAAKKQKNGKNRDRNRNRNVTRSSDQISSFAKTFERQVLSCIIEGVLLFATCFKKKNPYRF
jgi:hypothetical protein